MSLVTLHQAKQHLRITSSDEDEDLERKLDHATAIVLDYISRSSDADWTATIAAWDEITVPMVVQAAILRMCANLYQFRGDDSDKDREWWLSERDGYLAPDVTSLLRRYRDPVLA